MYYKNLHETAEEYAFNPDQNKLLHSFVDNRTDTLVIHPFDQTTKFLSAIYEGKGWNVLTDSFVENDVVAVLIQNHDRIICCGHGSKQGLFGENEMIINSSLVPLLKEKELVCIWCHADLFLKENGLRGFYSGMFISETNEAKLYNITTNELTIELSNDLFAKTMNKYIDSEDMLGNVKREYNMENDPIVTFNRNRLYSD